MGEGARRWGIVLLKVEYHYFYFFHFFFKFVLIHSCFKVANYSFDGV